MTEANGDTAIIPAEEGLATLPGETEMTLLLPFGKTLYNVPSSAVVSAAKQSNAIASGEDLGTLLFTKAPKAWMSRTDELKLWHLKGQEGTCVYTTFDVPGYPHERRILRLIGPTIAEKCFSHHLTEFWKRVNDDNFEDSVPKSAIRRNRVNALRWRKETPLDEDDRKRDVVENRDENGKERCEGGWLPPAGCPSRAQINPEHNKWPSVSAANSIKSCRVDPSSTKRKSTTSMSETDDDLSKVIKWQKVIPGIGKEGTYKINIMNGFVHIVQYNESSADGHDEEQ